MPVLEREYRQERMLLDSLTKELGTSIFGLKLLDLLDDVLLTKESGIIELFLELLPAQEREFRLERMLLDSLTKELGTTIFGLKLLDLLDDVSLTKESWIIKLFLELLDLLDEVSSTKLSDTSSEESLWRFCLLYSSLEDVSETRKTSFSFALKNIKATKI